MVRFCEMANSAVLYFRAALRLQVWALADVLYESSGGANATRPHFSVWTVIRPRL
jgi:hypothetical protein